MFKYRYKQQPKKGEQNETIMNLLMIQSGTGCLLPSPSAEPLPALFSQIQELVLALP